MTIKMLAKNLLEDNEQDVSSWEVISMYARLYKIFTDKKELHDFLLEYGEFGWKVDCLEKDKEQPHKLVIWLKL
jgi:hypothetical protein